MMKRLSPLVWIPLAGLVLALLLAFDVIPFLRGGFGWQWPRDLPALANMLPLLTITALYLVGAWVLLTRVRSTALTLTWALLGTIAIALATVALREDIGYALYSRTVSSVATGPHFAAVDTDWRGDGLYNWSAVMQGMVGRSGHVSVLPPGSVMWYALLNDLLRHFPAVTEPSRTLFMPYQCHNYAIIAYTPAQFASAWFGMLMPVWASLSVFPLYALARRLAPDHALYAVIWYPLIPAFVAFVPTWNMFNPLPSLLILWVFDVGMGRPLERGTSGYGWILAAGLLTSLMTFVNFAYLPFLGLLGFYTLLRYGFVERRADLPRPFTHWTRPFVVGVVFGVGLIAVWLLYFIMTGQTFFDLYATLIEEHLELDRPYLPWVWLHFWDWIMWTGLPLILLWWVGLWLWWRRRADSTHTPPIWGASLLLVIVIMTVGGIARGESGRVWTFLTPLVLVLALEALAQLSPASARTRGTESRRGNNGAFAKFWLPITVAQAAIMLALTITLSVMGTPGMVPPPDPPGSVATTHATNAQFDAHFALTGWDAESDGESVTLRLNWRGDVQMVTPYWFSALLVDPDGQPVGESTVWQPLDTRYPTTCWAPGEIVGETVTIPLPPGAQPGEWWVSLAAFSDDTASARLPVTLPDNSTDTQIGLGPVSVSQP